MLKKILLVCGLAFSITAPSHASVYLVGDSNVVNGDSGNRLFFQNVFNGTNVLNASSFYLSSAGVSASFTNIGSSSITSAGLSGKVFLVTGYNRTGYSSSELSAIANFVSGGGSLFLFGEGNSSFSRLNNALNTILAAVGSTMRLSTSQNFDNGGYTNLRSLSTTGPDTSGVNSWRTAYTAAIALGSDGQALISGIADNGYGTAVGFDDLGAAATVPLPAALPLLAGGLGILGFAGWRRKNSAA